MSGESIFYYKLNKEHKEKAEIIEDPHDIAADLRRNIARKKR
jgi:hypothetical protein